MLHREMQEAYDVTAPVLTLYNRRRLTIPFVLVKEVSCE